MSKQQIDATIKQLALEATRSAFARGDATIYELALAVRRANGSKQ